MLKMLLDIDFSLVNFKTGNNEIFFFEQANRIKFDDKIHSLIIENR